ncbi:calcium/sodium antiporter [Pseudoxanthomonas daejeonensis]|uniref:Calcium:sodium antiporter n=1 Tax=Pseudoxanthomonas daejeonensis TaxID=266062 RepID=A0ABQ6ZAX8_9GAMM|nr:calcium/sodium antiporter [Pseudoxanthomonas daejeonensis]KAF1697000.1 calcium:sodium antiporter [Pseudoxanthomonas daejeonensis]
MAEALGLFALGLLLLALGGDSVIKGVSGLAQHLGLRPFVAGLLLVAFGTSIPELAVNLRAVWEGQTHLALGNAVGSNVTNLGLTLGLAALAAPLLLRARMLVPLLVLLAVATFALMVFGLDGYVGRIEGAVLLLGFFATTAFLLRRGQREADEVRAEITGFATTRPGLGLNLVRLAIAIGLLYFGARWVVAGGLGLGEAWSLSPLMVGLLPVAIGTALPEIAAAIAAARRGQGDMVAGHVIGSSLFNLLAIVGGMAVFRPLALPASFVKFELPAVLVLTLLVYPLLRSGRRITQQEGGILCLVFLAWIALELLLFL